jgi:hypothetical protein
VKKEDLSMLAAPSVAKDEIRVEDPNIKQEIKPQESTGLVDNQKI